MSFLAFLFLNLAFADGSGPSAPQINFSGSTENQGKITADLGVTQLKDQPIQIEVQDSQGLAIPSEFEKRPVRLWLIADVASQCGPRKLDHYMNHLLPSLKGRLHPDTLISLGSYSSRQEKIVLSNTPLKDVKDISIHCDTDRLSSNFSALLSALARKETASNLPVFVWLFTSGHVSWDGEAIAVLKKTNLHANVFLYNPLINKQAEIAWASVTKDPTLRSHLTLSFLDPETEGEKTPEAFFLVRILPPLSFEGTFQSLKFIVKSGDQTLSQNIFGLQMPHRVHKHFLQKYYYAIIIGSISFFLLICAWIAYLIYRSKTCPQCERYIRRTDNHCFFCKKTGDAVLIFQDQVLPLISGKIEIGSNRGSPVRIFRKPGEKEMSFFRVEAGNSTSGRLFYRILRTIPATLSTILVNGEKMDEERYLGNADSIEVRNSEFIFYCQEPIHETS